MPRPQQEHQCTRTTTVTTTAALVVLLLAMMGGNGAAEAFLLQAPSSSPTATTTATTATMAARAWPFYNSPRRLHPAVQDMGSSAAPSPLWGPISRQRRWRSKQHDAMRAAAAVSDDDSDGSSPPLDVGSNDPPSGAATIVPELAPVIEPTPPGPNAKAIGALLAGEMLLGLLAFPIGYALKIDPLGSIKCAFSAAATAAVGGLGPALLNAVGLSVILTLPALILHKLSGEAIEDMLRESLKQIFGPAETTRRRPLLTMAIALVLSLSAGLGEELLFRGTLQPIVASLARSEVVGMVLSSLLFAVLHAATPRYLLLAFLLSVYLGWIQLSVGNLFVPIVVHTAFDVVGFAQSLFDKGKEARS